MANVEFIFDSDEDDVAIYDARKAELAQTDVGLMPEAVSARLIKGDSRLKAIRVWRSIKQSDLAKATGIGQSYLSDIERRRRSGTTETLKALAKALDVPAEWIL